MDEPKTSRSRGLLLFGGLGLGALMMFLADPSSGRRRRAMIRDRYQRTARKVQDGKDVVVRDAANRASGAMASAKGWLRRLGRHEDDAVLVERVRSALGRATSHASVIDTEANDGTITLRGDALASEVAAIVACVGRVAGVREVENRMNVHATPEGISALQGANARGGARVELMQSNWSPAWRSLAGAIGAGLTLAGWIRGGVRGLALGTVGSGLLTRAAINRDLKGLVKKGAAKGIVVQKSIYVDAPVHQVFEHWKVENFPQWMSHVREARPIGIDRHHWVVDGPANVPVEWDARIDSVVDDREMSWHSLPGSVVDNAGSVQFRPEADGTRVRVTVCYMPIGGEVGDAVAGALGRDPKSEMDDDLMRFKQMIEHGTPARDAAARARRTHVRLPAPLIRARGKSHAGD